MFPQSFSIIVLRQAVPLDMGARCLYSVGPTNGPLLFKLPIIELLHTIVKFVDRYSWYGMD